MRVGMIAVAAAAVGAAAPAEAATIVVSVEGYATGTRTRSEAFCMPVGSCDTTTAIERDFRYQVTFDTPLDQPLRFSVGPNSNAGVASGTITRAGFDQYGNMAFAGSDFVFGQTQLLVDNRGIYGAITTTLRAPTFTVRQVFPAPVPEPATWAMMILGFGAIGYAMRRKTVLRFV